MSVEANMTDLVAACRAKLDARRTITQAEEAARKAREPAAAAEAAAMARRDAALRRLVQEDGVPARQVPVRVRERLLAEGFSSEEIEGLGVSYGAVRLAVERPR